MIKINDRILGSNKLVISLDISLKKNALKKPIVIFCHGFKGFKDWGAWNLVAESFAKKDFVFIKFNFSHNGTTPENLLDFENLDAFAKNNYFRELEDLSLVLEYINSKDFPIEKSELDLKKINLIGHSRGGGAVLVKTLEESTVKKVATWASIDSYDRFGTPSQIKKWKQDGAHIFINGRTGQKMPIKYQFYEDYIKNIDRLDIKKTVSKIEKPILVVHGTEDPAVHFDSAENIVSWSKNAKLLAIDKANHVFGASHPFKGENLPEELQKVVDETILFFKSE